MISFVNSFLSYLLLLLLIVVLAGVAVFAGITLRKKRMHRQNRRTPSQATIPISAIEQHSNLSH